MTARSCTLPSSWTATAGGPRPPPPRTDGHRPARAPSAALSRRPSARASPPSRSTPSAATTGNAQPAETGALMALFAAFLRKERGALLHEGIRVSVIGRRDRLPASLVAEIETVEALPPPVPACTSASPWITPPATPSSPARWAPTLICSSGPAANSASATSCSGSAPTPNCSFLPPLWPDFTAADLHAALLEFRSRQPLRRSRPGRLTKRSPPVCDRLSGIESPPLRYQRRIRPCLATSSAAAPAKPALLELRYWRLRNGATTSAPASPSGWSRNSCRASRRPAPPSAAFSPPPSARISRTSSSSRVSPVGRLEQVADKVLADEE